MTEREVCLALTEAEALEAKSGNFTAHEVGPSSFLCQLLDLEDMMYVV